MLGRKMDLVEVIRDPPEPCSLAIQQSDGE